MAQKKYASRIDRPTIHTTSKGGRYVRPFDILRSESGRATINSLAKDKVDSGSTGNTNSNSEKRSPSGSDR